MSRGQLGPCGFSHEMTSLKMESQCCQCTEGIRDMRSEEGEQNQEEKVRGSACISYSPFLDSWFSRNASSFFLK